jgi:DNA repair and recombination protein RadB
VKVLARWIPTGCGSLDRALEGGLKPGGTTLLYGEAETGKTTLAMQCAVNSARMGCKALYVDSDGTFSPERLSQIVFQDFEEVSQSLMLVKPSSFREQVEIVDNLERYVSKRFGLIVFDTITSLYRPELVDKKETFNLNRELNRQVAALAQIAKAFDVSVLLLSQVRSVVGETDIAPVATRVLKFWSDSVIKLTRTGRPNIVRASVGKSEGKETRQAFYLIIGENGIHDYNR